MISYHKNLRWFFTGKKETKFLIQSVTSFPLYFFKIQIPIYNHRNSRHDAPLQFHNKQNTNVCGILANQRIFYIIDLPFRMLMTQDLCFLFILRLTPTKNVIIFRLPFGCTKNMNNGRVNLQSLGKHPKYSTQEEIMEQYGNGGAKVLKLLKVKKHKV